MSTPVDTLITQARAAAEEARESGTSAASDRQRLERLAVEFESMLLNQVLRDMRKAGKWDEDKAEGDGFGSGALMDTIDTELVKVMSQAQGLGLTRQLMEAFDRLQGGTSTAPAMTGASSVAARVSPTLPAPTTGQTLLDTKLGDVKEQLEVTSGFGWRRDPFTGQTRFHKGMDLRAAYGQDVSSARPGTVAFSGTQGDYGTTVVVAHPDGTRTRYAHLSAALVATGDTVGTGQVIGRVGSSGRASGPHLHVEVTDRAGRPVDPATFTALVPDP